MEYEQVQRQKKRDESKEGGPDKWVGTHAAESLRLNAKMVSAEGLSRPIGPTSPGLAAVLTATSREILPFGRANRSTTAIRGQVLVPALDRSEICRSRQACRLDGGRQQLWQPSRDCQRIGSRAAWFSS